MTQIHYKSDFDFIFELEGGFPTFNFGGKITSGVSEAVYFTFNCINKECKNCFNDNGKIHVVCDKHGLPPGKLMLELYAYLPNSLYPDGERTIVCKTPIDIELTRSGCTEPIETPQIEVVIPYAVIDAYRLAVANGYEGTQEEYYAALNELPQVVDEAKDVVSQVDDAVVNANKAVEDATNAVEQAQSAVERANKAVLDVNSVAADAQAATENANQATNNANVAAQRANDAADKASSYADEYVAIKQDVEGLEQKIDGIMPYIEFAYGIEFDTTVAAPECTRIGNMALHSSLPIQSKMRGCLLDDNGNVVRYLNANDWTDEVRDGSQGQVMVEIPSYYRKFSTDGTKRSVLMSELPLDGFHKVPKMYVSAYEATLQRSVRKLSSVRNMTADWRGGKNTASWDNTYRELLGRPVSNIETNNMLAFARNRNNAATAEWNIYTYDCHKNIYWLFVVEYATFNSQADYNSAKNINGFMQGGLGAGVTTITWGDISAFNSASPFVPCGHTDWLGNRSGCGNYTAENDDKTILINVSVPRYRGIENPFGHIAKMIDGVVLENGEDVSKVYTCSDPNDIDNIEKYVYVGDATKENNKGIKELLFGEYGELIPTKLGASSTTYMCDGWQASYGIAYAYFQIGGAMNSDTSAGMCNVQANSSHSGSSASNTGTRLCFHPQNSND